MTQGWFNCNFISLHILTPSFIKKARRLLKLMQSLAVWMEAEEPEEAEEAHLTDIKSSAKVDSTAKLPLHTSASLESFYRMFHLASGNMHLSSGECLDSCACWCRCGAAVQSLYQRDEIKKTSGSTREPPSRLVGAQAQSVRLPPLCKDLHCGTNARALCALGLPELFHCCWPTYTHCHVSPQNSPCLHRSSRQETSREHSNRPPPPPPLPPPLLTHPLLCSYAGQDMGEGTGLTYGLLCIVGLWLSAHQQHWLSLLLSQNCVGLSGWKITMQSCVSERVTHCVFIHGHKVTLKTPWMRTG